jgi:bacterial/archaeal transporter family-2 protein
MPLAILLAIVGGAALVVQNAIMASIARSGVSLTGALFVNSAIGLCLLGMIESWRAGPGFAIDLAGRAQWWFILPGLLGTAFVFASLYGYRHQGAATTIVLIVAAQLATGLAFDAAGLTGTARAITAERMIGVALLFAGAFLVVRSR